MERKSATLASLHKEAVELKAKAEKELAEAQNLKEELEKREHDLSSGLFGIFALMLSLTFFIERRTLQKERTDAVKERKKLAEEIKDSTHSMILQHQNLRESNSPNLQNSSPFPPIPSTPPPFVSPSPIGDVSEDDKENVST